MASQGTTQERTGRVLGPTDPALTFRGAVSLQHKDGWLAPWRAHHEAAYLYFPKGSVGRLAQTSCVRVGLRTDSDWIALRYHTFGPRPKPGVPTPPAEPALLDVVCDGVLVHTVELECDVDG